VTTSTISNVHGITSVLSPTVHQGSKIFRVVILGSRPWGPCVAGGITLHGLRVAAVGPDESLHLAALLARRVGDDALTSICRGALDADEINMTGEMRDDVSSIEIPSTTSGRVRTKQLRIVTWVLSGTGDYSRHREERINLKDWTTGATFGAISPNAGPNPSETRKDKLYSIEGRIYCDRRGANLTLNIESAGPAEALAAAKGILCPLYQLDDADLLRDDCDDDHQHYLAFHRTYEVSSCTEEHIWTREEIESKRVRHQVIDVEDENTARWLAKRQLG